MKKERIALVFGTFAPLHQGHIDLIQRAKRQCDRVRVIVSGYEGDRGEEVGLTLQKRFRYIREAFSNDELTQVYKLDETELPRYPLGWEPWLQTALNTIQYQTETEELIFYVGEKAYKEELEARGFEVHLEERRFGKSKQILEIHRPALPSPVHEKSLDHGERQQRENDPCKGLGSLLRCTC